MKKTIALCGAHGTGKTTLLNKIVEEFDIPPLARTVRNLWEDNGVSDFEKLPLDVRTVFEKHLILNQIRLEETQWDKGFVTDRSVLDYMGYTVVSSDMSGVDKSIFEQLVLERLKKYDAFIYFPVEFPAEPEFLRAHPGLQQKVADVLEEYLDKWLSKDQYCIVTGSVEERMAQVKNYLSGDKM